VVGARWRYVIGRMGYGLIMGLGNVIVQPVIDNNFKYRIARFG
jgi:hypothetical protein